METTTTAETLKIGDRFTIAGYATKKVDNGTFEVCNILDLDESHKANPELLYLRVVRGAVTTGRNSTQIRGGRRSWLVRLEGEGFLKVVR
jgi:hypothetical protein